MQKTKQRIGAEAALLLRSRYSEKFEKTTRYSKKDRQINKRMKFHAMKDLLD